MLSIKTSVSVTQNVVIRQLPERKIQRRLKRAVHEPPHPLRIEPLPHALQWLDEQRFWLVHQETGLRVSGSFSITEAQYIREISKDWDWRVDTRDRKVRCGIQLFSLAEAVCKRSAKGGEA